MHNIRIKFNKSVQLNWIRFQGPIYSIGLINILSGNWQSGGFVLFTFTAFKEDLFKMPKLVILLTQIKKRKQNYLRMLSYILILNWNVSDTGEFMQIRFRSPCDGLVRFYWFSFVNCIELYKSCRYFCLLYF